MPVAVLIGKIELEDVKKLTYADYQPGFTLHYLTSAVPKDDLHCPTSARRRCRFGVLLLESHFSKADRRQEARQAVRFDCRIFFYR